MPVPYRAHGVIHDPKYENQPAAPTANGRTVCYAHQKDDLRPILRRRGKRLLADPTVGTLIVEHRDRLARMNAGLSAKAQGPVIV